jgi:hypothetical protein
MVNASHWATIDELVKPEASALLSYVTGEDKSRVLAYDLYESIFWTAPDSFQLTMRGQEGEPVYVPSGRQVVEMAHRYMAPKMQIVTDPLFGTPQQQAEAMIFFNEFAARERFYSKFSSAKLYGLMRGDQVWHVFADEDRPEGARVSVFPIHAGTYFPEFLEDDLTQIIKVHLVEPTMLGDKAAVYRLTYEKESGVGGPSRILASEAIYEAENWGQPGTDQGEVLLSTEVPQFALPDSIDAIPVYHIPNVYDPDFPWGSSEMRGIERLMRAINQGITDEETALVLEGLGVYVTTAGQPIEVDEATGEEVEAPWVVAPGHVIELPAGSDLKRVSGVASVAPYMDHLRFLLEQIDATVGGNDVTRARFDVATAESGIALALKMSPLFSRMEEKELVTTDVMNQMLFDLRKWFTEYEPLSFEEIRWTPIYGPKIPINKKETFTQVMEMVTNKVTSTRDARRKLIDLGWVFSSDEDIEGEIQREVQVAADAEAARILGTAGGA